MTYVPVNLWVPDTPEGPTMTAVNLRLCEQCLAPIPEGHMDEHMTAAHTPPEVTPH